MIRKISVLVFALAFFSCNQQKETEANTDLLYFDIKGYFGKEISRLQKLNPIVNKTVSVNGVAENNTTKIASWAKELAIFVNADINKASWKGNFKLKELNGIAIYTSDNKKIPIKKISVTRSGLKTQKIEIITDNKNILYRSQDTLIYFPDSLYSIRKHQKIRLLKEKQYSITGKLK
ncbi:MAG: hypothetical protein J7577_16465 [Sphingobacteriaceae bacterium]|nr:hypothetical protein [Sphingobacteriaceae bacterium]